MLKPINSITCSIFNFKTSIMENELFDFGMIGLGVMGSNLLQNMAAHGFKVIGFDTDKQKAVLLESLAAKVNGEPCTAYMGKDAAGHYVKMVHNGIEYAIMQLISEVYDLLKRGLGLNNDELHEVFEQWNNGELKSFLIDITGHIFLQKDDITENRLLDMILDKAGSKGTGKWTSQDAMDLPVSIPTIDAAVAARDLSGYKEERVKAAAIYKPVIRKIVVDKDAFIYQTGEALYAATVICYAQC